MFVRLMKCMRPELGFRPLQHHLRLSAHHTLGWALPTLLLWTGCGGEAAPPGTNGGDSGALADPFPSSPPDGAVAEAASTPGDYRPSAAIVPSTDIWLARLVVTGSGLTLQDLRNVTNRDGYEITSRPSRPTAPLSTTRRRWTRSRRRSFDTTFYPTALSRLRIRLPPVSSLPRTFRTTMPSQ